MNLIKNNETFEAVFGEHKITLGKDLERYRGHCYRLLNYLNYWQLEEQELKVSEIAIAFHDIGIWTHKTMDYLEVSFAEAKKYAEKNKLDIDISLLENMIVSHHQLSKVKDSLLVEKLRKADLIDLTFGMVKFGIPRKVMDAIDLEFPNYGFQKDIYKKVFSHAIKNLGNPFPMLKL